MNRPEGVWGTMRKTSRSLWRRQTSGIPNSLQLLKKLESLSELPGVWADELIHGYQDPLVSVSPPLLSGAFTSTLLPVMSPL